MFHNIQNLAFLARCSQGSVPSFFAFALLPMLLMVGAAIDYGRAAQVHAALQQASDGAALTVAKLMQDGLTQQELKDRAVSFLQASMSNDAAQLVAGPTVAADKSQVCIEVAVSMKPAVMRLAGVTEMPVRAYSCAAMSDQFFEVALVLDTTGSMASSSGRESKIQSLRTAATGFVDYMYGSVAMKERTRISVVPFAETAAVDPSVYRDAAWLDPYALSPEHWRSWLMTDIRSRDEPANRMEIFDWLASKRSAWAWDGCLESRAYPFNTQETAPTTAAPQSLYAPALAPDEPDGGYYGNDYIDDDDGVCRSKAGNTTESQWRACKYKSPKVRSTSSSRGPNSICSARPLLRLTNQSWTIKTLVNALGANGSTNIHEGLAWGWRTLSPLGPFGDGKPYGEQFNNKIIVLMTDGMNTWSRNGYASLNGSDYSAYGYFTNAASRLPPGFRNPYSSSDARDAIDQLTRETCANARAAGVKIYTIGFSVPRDPIDSQGLELLRDCAGAPERSFVATDGDALVRIFQEIAVGIGQLRLAK